MWGAEGLTGTSVTKSKMIIEQIYSRMYRIGGTSIEKHQMRYISDKVIDDD